MGQEESVVRLVNKRNNVLTSSNATESLSMISPSTGTLWTGGRPRTRCPVSMEAARIGFGGRASVRIKEDINADIMNKRRSCRDIFNKI